MVDLFYKIESFFSKRRINWFQTFIINFHMLSFKEAVKFPIICYGPVVFVGGGKIKLTDVRKGVLKIGFDLAAYRSCSRTTLKIQKGGLLKICGEVILMQGSSVIVGNDATLIMKNHSTLGDRAEIICRRSIEVGEYSEITWDCQVTDFASHPIQNMKTCFYKNMFRPVHIGNYCWIGNRTTIQPGTILPDRIIVASNSLLNKNYTEYGIKPYSLIGGMPAKLLQADVKRNYEEDNMITHFFMNTTEECMLISEIKNSHE